MLVMSGRHLRQHFVAYLALFVALGGTSFAAANALVPSNSVGYEAGHQWITAEEGLQAWTAPTRSPRAAGVSGTGRAARRAGASWRARRAGAGWSARVPQRARRASLSVTNGPGTTEAGVDREYGSHPGATTGNGYSGMGLACIRADGLEPNDTRPQATDATSFGSGGERWASGTISPAGNDDWYKLTGVDLGASVILADSVRSLMDVYRNGTQVAAGKHCYVTSAGVADWEIRVYAPRLDYYTVVFNLPAEVACP